jgi:ribosomal protein L11 methylase PrmA
LTQLHVQAKQFTNLPDQAQLQLALLVLANILLLAVAVRVELWAVQAAVQAAVLVLAAIFTQQAGSFQRVL